MNRKHPQQGPTNLRTRAFSPPSLFADHSSAPSLTHSLFHSLSQKEGPELTKCQLTLNVCPSHLPLWTADSSGVWVNTKGPQRIIILLLAPSPCFSPSPIPLFGFQWGGFTVQCTVKGWYKMTFQRIEEQGCVASGQRLEAVAAVTP